MKTTNHIMTALRLRRVVLFVLLFTNGPWFIL